jgi:hypothetical protein
MHVWLNDGAGTLVSPAAHDNEGGNACNAQGLGTAADMDLDGWADIVTAVHHHPSCPVQVRIFQGHGDGGFTTAAEVSFGLPKETEYFHSTVADLNGDELPDIVVADSGAWPLGPGYVHVVPNLGGMQFGPAASHDMGDSHVFWVAPADVDGDGDLDVAAWTHPSVTDDIEEPLDRSVEILINDGTGKLTKGQKLLLEQLPQSFILGVVEAGDLDGDGDVDLLATTSAQEQPGRLWQLENDGRGTFSVIDVIDVGQQPSSISIEDFDRDGDFDVALMFNHKGGLGNFDKLMEPYLVIFENDGAGVLTVVQEFINPNVENRWSLEAADFNGDGYLDLSLPESQGAVRVHLNQGDGRFDVGVSYDAVAAVIGQAIADFDSDGRTDIALIAGQDYIMTLFNRACPGCAADMNGDGVLNILDFVAFQQAFVSGDMAADCDGDGVLSNPLDFVCFKGAFGAGCD